MDNKIWHTYEANFPHENNEEMKVSLERAHNRLQICVEVAEDEAGKIVTRINFTLAELKRLVELGEQFDEMTSKLSQKVKGNIS